jgi:hypothetical protein
MKHHPSITHVGAQDPELRNSPIAEEEDEDTDVILQQVPARRCAGSTAPSTRTAPTS